jgi:coenzyme F420-reducing hydrogenase delta subunit
MSVKFKRESKKQVENPSQQEEKSVKEVVEVAAKKSSKNASILRTTKIVGFICNWINTTTKAELDTKVGTTPITAPSNAVLLRVMCSARVNRPLILQSFNEGADGIVLFSCGENKCHHKDAYQLARERIEATSRFLPNIGIESERLVSPLRLKN